MKNLTPQEQQVFDNVEKYGCHVMAIFSRKDDPKPSLPFTYSIGLYKNYQLPEILIIGLRHELSHVLINNICYNYKQGKTLEVDAFNKGILDHFECLVVGVEKMFYPDYFGWARWFYSGDNFPVLQIVYPTVKGIFPWEKDFPESVKYPILNRDFAAGFNLNG